MLARRRRRRGQRDPEHGDVDERERRCQHRKPRPSQRERHEAGPEEQGEVLQPEDVGELEHPRHAVEQSEQRRQADEQDEPGHHRSHKAHRGDASRARRAPRRSAPARARRGSAASAPARACPGSEASPASAPGATRARPARVLRRGARRPRRPPACRCRAAGSTARTRSPARRSGRRPPRARARPGCSGSGRPRSARPAARARALRCRPPRARHGRICPRSRCSAIAPRLSSSGVSGRRGAGSRGRSCRCAGDAGSPRSARPAPPGCRCRAIAAFRRDDDAVRVRLADRRLALAVGVGVGRVDMPIPAAAACLISSTFSGVCRRRFVPSPIRVISMSPNVSVRAAGIARKDASRAYTRRMGERVAPATTLGFVGLGHMGGNMAARFLAARLHRLRRGPSPRARAGARAPGAASGATHRASLRRRPTSSSARSPTTTCSRTSPRARTGCSPASPPGRSGSI